jgi:cation transporter-like permease
MSGQEFNSQTTPGPPSDSDLPDSVSVSSLGTPLSFETSSPESELRSRGSSNPYHPPRSPSSLTESEEFPIVFHRAPGYGTTTTQLPASSSASTNNSSPNNSSSSTSSTSSPQFIGAFAHSHSHSPVHEHSHSHPHSHGSTEHSHAHSHHHRHCTSQVAVVYLSLNADNPNRDAGATIKEETGEEETGEGKGGEGGEEKDGGKEGDNQSGGLNGTVVIENIQIEDDIEEEEFILMASPTYWDIPVYKHIISRLPLLIILLLLQSASSIILQAFKGLVQDHYVITTYLTMLVGTGGNAGGQSAAIVLQGLATGTISRSQTCRFLGRETLVACGVSVAVAFVGFLRVWLLSNGQANIIDALAMGISLLFIVFCSLVIGSLLPLLLSLITSFISQVSRSLALLLDPATATFPIFQVVMDVTGVTIVCLTCTLVYSLAGEPP